MEKSTSKLYRYKVIKSGDEIELYRYELSQEKTIKETNKDLIEDDVVNEENDNVQFSSDDDLENVNDPENGFSCENDDLIVVCDGENVNYLRNPHNIHVTKRNIRRLINANVFQYPEKDKFITLTFEKDVDRDKVVYCFKQFNKRLKRKYKNYGYIAIIERGTKNTERLHMHVLFFGLPFIPNRELRSIWKNGYVKVNAVDSYFDLANYITKYIDKTLEDGSYIPKGKKFYFTSRGLNKPQEELIYTDYDMKKYIDENCTDKKVVFETTFESEHLGCVCHYIKFSKQRNVVPVFKNEDDKIAYYEMLEELAQNEEYEEYQED